MARLPYLDNSGFKIRSQQPALVRIRRVFCPLFPRQTFGSHLQFKFFASAATPTTQTAWGFSIDHNLTDRQKLHGTFYREKHTSITFSRLFSTYWEPANAAADRYRPFLDLLQRDFEQSSDDGRVRLLGELNNEFTVHTIAIQPDSRPPRKRCSSND